MLEGGIEGGREGKEGAREEGRNQLLIVHNVVKSHSSKYSTGA